MDEGAGDRQEETRDERNRNWIWKCNLTEMLTQRLRPDKTEFGPGYLSPRAHRGVTSARGSVTHQVRDTR